MTTIRPFKATDRAATARVYYRAIHEGASGFYTPAQCANWATSPEPDYATPCKLLDQWCWVSEEGGQITGFMSLAHDGLLDMAFVIPEVMGKGTAAALYDVLIAKARTEGLPRLTVDASYYSHRFLRKRGWQVDWQGDRIYDGIAFLCYDMSLMLDEAPATA